MSFIYNISILFYGFGIRIAALFNKKANQRLKGGSAFFSNFKFEKFKGHKIVWIHCASLGEFEQGRPLIERIKNLDPTIKIFLTFFSPSGYEVRKDFALADQVSYMPLDTPNNARSFVEMLKPDLAIFVKYEFWFNHLKELQKNKIPHILVSGIFRKEQLFFKSWGSYFRNILAGFTKLYIQDEASAELLKQINITQFDVCGDTRFDRVIQIAAQKRDIPFIPEFKNNSLLAVFGSTWPVDEVFLCEMLTDLKHNIRFIFVQHNVNEENLKNLESNLKIPYKRYSHITDIKDLDKLKVIIVDSVGMLSSLYAYADLAYVGGGFGVNVHNTAEPAVFGIPVVFGPNHKKFKEAIDLIDCKGGFSAESSAQIKEIILRLLNSEKDRIQAGNFAKNYILSHAGASDFIMKDVARILNIENLNVK